MTRLGIASLVFMMVQAVLFGVGTILVLCTPMAEHAMQLMPWVVGVSFVIAVPLSWLIAPSLRARFRAPKQRGAEPRVARPSILG